MKMLEKYWWVLVAAALIYTLFLSPNQTTLTTS